MRGERVIGMATFPKSSIPFSDTHFPCKRQKHLIIVTVDGVKDLKTWLSILYFSYLSRGPAKSDGR